MTIELISEIIQDINPEITSVEANEQAVNIFCSDEYYDYLDLLLDDTNY